MISTTQNKSLLQSVQNGLFILKLFSKAKPVWGITDMSKELQLPKSTVSRLINDLVKEGYVTKVRLQIRLRFISPIFGRHYHVSYGDTSRSI